MVSAITLHAMVSLTRSSQPLKRSVTRSPDDGVSGTDNLGAVLHLLRLTGTFYCNSELTAPWGIDVPEMPGQMLLIAVLEGRCLLELDGDPAIHLAHGELVLVPKGDPMRVKSSPDAYAVPLQGLPVVPHSQIYETLSFGGGGPSTRLGYCALTVDAAVGRRLVELLPKIILLDSLSAGAGSWLHSSLRFFAEEAREQRPGGEAVLTRLADIMVVQVIRLWLETERADKGWLAALRDPRIGRALQVVHASPETAWSVARLAETAGMSRSGFAAQFNALLDETPMQYVSWWRMKLARIALADTGQTVAEIGARFGYDSEAAFVRAFKRIEGTTPGAVRREAGH